MLESKKNKILFLQSQHQNNKLELDHNPPTSSMQGLGAQRIDTGWEGLGRRIENKSRRFYDAFYTYTHFQYSRTRQRSEKLLDNSLTDASKTGATSTTNTFTHVTKHSRNVNGSSIIKRTNDMRARETNKIRLGRRHNKTLPTMAAATTVTTNGSSRNTQEQEIEESRNENAVLYKFKGELAIWRPEYLKDCTSNGLTMQRDTDIAGGFTGTKVLAY